MASRSTTRFSLVSILFLVVCITKHLSVAAAIEYVVGGDLGWRTLPPDQDQNKSYYSSWADKYTFRLGDRLKFNNIEQTGSVMLVNSWEYMNCNTTESMQELKGSDTVSYEIRHEGIHFFISSEVHNCLAGLKMKFYVKLGRERDAFSKLLMENYQHLLWALKNYPRITESNEEQSY